MLRLWLYAVALWLGVTSAARAAELRVFAAVSLSDALVELGERFERESGVAVRFNFGASNDLARQIVAGAGAEVFLAADDHQAMRVIEAGRASAERRFELLGNVLVVIAPAGAATPNLAGPRELLRFERLAVADPAGVPLGVYAREWLEREGLWAGLAPRIVPMLDARATVSAVASGSLPAGIVYSTDAAASSRVSVIYRLPAERGPRVRYVVVPLSGGSSPALVERWLRFLHGEVARGVFERHGFSWLASAAGG